MLPWKNRKATGIAEIPPPQLDNPELPIYYQYLTDWKLILHNVNRVRVIFQVSADIVFLSVS